MRRVSSTPYSGLGLKDHTALADIASKPRCSRSYPGHRGRIKDPDRRARSQIQIQAGGRENVKHLYFLKRDRQSHGRDEGEWVEQSGGEAYKDGGRGEETEVQEVEE